MAQNTSGPTTRGKRTCSAAGEKCYHRIPARWNHRIFIITFEVSGDRWLKARNT